MPNTFCIGERVCYTFYQNVFLYVYMYEYLVSVCVSVGEGNGIRTDGAAN